MHTLFTLIGLALSAACLSASVLAADLEPEIGRVETMETPGEHAFITLGYIGGGGGIFDADTGDMLGKLRVSDFTSAAYFDRGRDTIFIPAIFYSRRTYGERTDLLIFNDVETLAPVAEVAVPKKLATVFHRAVINPVGDRFIGLFNMTPAMSVSIVDVEAQKFVGEISTAGCGFVYPLEGRRFMQICGDGTVQVIDLNGDGEEAARKRSSRFFDIEEDPVFDLALEKPDGWLLISFEGLVFEVTVDGNDIDVSTPWSLLSEEDVAESWRVGGNEPFAYNAETGQIFTLMHQGGPDSHEEAGMEVWAFDLATQRRGYRLQLDGPSLSIAVSQDRNPLLYVGTLEEPMSVQVHEAGSGRLLQVIPEVGSAASHIQAF